MSFERVMQKFFDVFMRNLLLAPILILFSAWSALPALPVPVPPPILIPCPCCLGLAKLAEKLGLDKPNFSVRTFETAGNESDPALAVNLWILGMAPLAEKYSELRELSLLLGKAAREIEAEPHAFAAERVKAFQNEMDGILQRSGKNIRIAWRDELAKLEMELRKEGKWKLDPGTVGPEFFIPYDVYGKIIESRAIPARDTHDLLSHLPPFLVFPEYVQLFNERTQQFARLDERWGAIELAYKNELTAEQKGEVHWGRHLSKRALKENIRYTTFEAIPLVLKNADHPIFVSLGGHAYSPAYALIRYFSGAYDAAKVTKHLVAFDSQDHHDPFDIVTNGFHSRLPGWERFRSARAVAWQRFENARQARGQTDTTVMEMRSRVESILKNIFPKVEQGDYSLSDPNRRAEAIAVAMQTASHAIAREPVLAQHLSQEAYLEYYGSTVNLLREYLDWFDER